MLIHLLSRLYLLLLHVLPMTIIIPNSSLILIMIAMLNYAYLLYTIYNMSHYYLYLDYLLSLIMQIGSSSFIYMYHVMLVDLHIFIHYSMLMSYSSLLYMVIVMFIPHHSMLSYTSLVPLPLMSYPTYSAHYNYYTPDLLLYLYFMHHLYISNNMFSPHLLSFLYSSLLYYLL